MINLTFIDLKFFKGNCHVVLWYIDIDIYITVKHNKILIISSINAPYFGLSGPISDTKLREIKHN